MNVWILSAISILLGNWIAGSLLGHGWAVIVDRLYWQAVGVLAVFVAHRVAR